METMKRPNYVEELLEIFRSSLSKEELLDKISDYHENDIAEAFEHLTEEERKKLYPLLGAERMAEIFTYIEEPDEYLKELNLNQVAQVISHMDSDDAVDVLDELDDLIQEKLVASTLLIWFGKSERPVPTTAAPAARASSGMISGVGFAIGNTIAP
mgnify:CR=1 FL=1